MEKNAIAKGATNNQLSAIRRVDEANARERLRQEKAASRAASRLSMTPAMQSMNNLLSPQSSPTPASQGLIQARSQSGSLGTPSSLSREPVESSSASNDVSEQNRVQAPIA